MIINRENKKIVQKFMHIEIVHDDPKAAAEFMAEAFGAVQVEKEFSEWIGNAFGIDIIHMMFGGIVYQILKPSDTLPEWQEQLKTHGPSIHNVSLQVRDADALRQKLLDMGVKEGHDWRGFNTFAGTGFSTDQTMKGCFFDARKECGLCFEFDNVCPEWEPGELR